MEIFTHLIDLILHLPEYLGALLQQYGPWVYLFLFLIVFCETGLVVTPILPGDSLLFVAGGLCTQPGGLNIGLLIALLVVAAWLGDGVNYHIGRASGHRLIAWDKGRFIKESYMQQTRQFFVKHGGKAIIFARFAPIIRTYAPFMAGLAEMPRQRFMAFNVVGGVVWVVAFSLAGYWFANIPHVQKNLHWFIVGIVIVSLIPVAWQYIASRRAQRSPAAL